MTILQILAALYMDGYTFQHWLAVVWMISVNGFAVMMILAAINRFLFWKRYGL